MKIKKMIAAVVSAAVLAASVPMTGLMPDPLGLTASAIAYDDDGLYISSHTLRGVREDVTEVYVPDDVTKIAAGAFSRCKDLAYIYIPESVTSISGNFSSCENLEAIEVASDNMKYSSVGGVLFNYEETELLAYPIGNIAETYYMPYTVERIRANAFSGCTFLTEVVFRYGVEYITGFSGCTNLKRVEIPASVVTISSDAFLGCKKLSEIYVDPYNEKYSSEDGVLFDKSGSRLIQYPMGKEGTEYSIPESVTEIGDNAFANCMDLAVEFPSSIQTIGEKAFYNCDGLGSISFPEDLTTIGNEAFLGCIRISSVELPSSVTTIGNGAFAYCSMLTGVTFSNDTGDLINIGDEAFMDCTNLSSINIPDGVKTIGARAFSNCTRLNSVTIPSSVTTISNEAFSGCTRMLSATILGSPKLGDAVFGDGIKLYGEKGSSVEKYVEDNRLTHFYFFQALSSGLKGDANDDGSIGVADLTAILSHIVGKKILTGNGLNNADVNDDGLINLQDVIQTLKIFVG